MVAIDGKTLRHSHDPSNNKTATHTVSAWTTKSHLALGKIKTAEKPNKIIATPVLLHSLALEGCLITIGAMNGQKEIEKIIVDKEYGYLLTVNAFKSI